MQKRIHILQHVDFESPGAIVSWANTNGFSISYTRFYENKNLPLASEVDMVVVMGGPMSFDDDEKYDWMAVEKRFIGEFLALDRPIIGICLGAQFIADQINMSARHGNGSEIGWFPITFSNEIQLSQNMPLFPNSMMAFHWHGDTFEIPTDAIRICSSEAYPNQGFLYRKNVVGLQFHLEITVETISAMISNCESDLIPATYVQSKEEILAQLNNIDQSNNLLYSILDNISG